MQVMNESLIVFLNTTPCVESHPLWMAFLYNKNSFKAVMAKIILHLNILVF